MHVVNSSLRLFNVYTQTVRVQKFFIFVLLSLTEQNVYCVEITIKCTLLREALQLLQLCLQFYSFPRHSLVCLGDLVIQLGIMLSILLYSLFKSRSYSSSNTKYCFQGLSVLMAQSKHFLLFSYGTKKKDCINILLRNYPKGWGPISGSSRPS